MPEPRRRRKRARGRIEKLLSGALRVIVYAGTDPLTGKRHYLREVIPAGPEAADLAEKAALRLANQVDERRRPRTNATLDQLLDRYLEVLDVGRSTHRMYTRYLEKHVRPFVGRLKAGAVDVETLDSLYAELRRCRTHCTDRRGVDHRTPRTHECDERCQSHRCKPLSSTTIRHIHFLLRGAYEKGVRWRWVSRNPVLDMDAPRARKPDPRPPTVEEAARIVEEAREDLDWGMLVWLTMTTGARRGELCGLHWSDVDLRSKVLTYRRAIAQYGKESEEKDTKTHQQRRVALDPETVKALTENWERCTARAEALGVPMARDAFVFSLAPDGSEYLLPSSVSQRYGRLATRLGIDTHLHCLRHYSATELIAAGVDVRTVARRLGHGGGGVTTLRVYAAWLAEADQRASAGLAARAPGAPGTGHEQDGACAAEARHAARAPGRRAAGADPCWRLCGEELPAWDQRARCQAPSTVHRAYALLREWGLIVGVAGERPRVLQQAVRAAVHARGPGCPGRGADPPAASQGAVQRSAAMAAVAAVGLGRIRPHLVARRGITAGSGRLLISQQVQPGRSGDRVTRPTGDHGRRIRPQRSGNCLAGCCRPITVAWCHALVRR